MRQAPADTGNTDMDMDTGIARHITAKHIPATDTDITVTAADKADKKMTGDDRKGYFLWKNI